MRILNIFTLVLFLVLLTIILPPRLIALSSGGKRLNIVNLRISFSVPYGAHGLTYRLRIYNLTNCMFKLIWRASIKYVPPEYSMEIPLRMWVIPASYSHITSKTTYEHQDIWIYVYAFDTNRKAIYYGSTTLSIFPDKDKVIYVTLNIEEYTLYSSDKQVSAEEVPDTNQYDSRIKQKCEQAVMCAAKISGMGTYVKCIIPSGTSVKIQSFERFYYSYDDHPRDPDAVWYMRDWSPSGYTIILIDGDHIREVNDSASMKWYLTNVKFVTYTSGSVNEASDEGSPLPDCYSFVVVKFFASDTSSNGVSSERWNPLSSGSYYDEFDRPEIGEDKFPLSSVYSLQEVMYQFEFWAVVGCKKCEVDIWAEVSFRYRCSDFILKAGISSWNQVPGQYNKFVIYTYDSAKSRVRGAFEG